MTPVFANLLDIARTSRLGGTIIRALAVCVAGALEALIGVERLV